MIVFSYILASKNHLTTIPTKCVALKTKEGTAEANKINMHQETQVGTE